jgi:hypothetical protein
MARHKIIQRLVIENRTDKHMDEVLQHVKATIHNNRVAGRKPMDPKGARFSDGVRTSTASNEATSTLTVIVEAKVND